MAFNLLVSRLSLFFLLYICGVRGTPLYARPSIYYNEIEESVINDGSELIFVEEAALSDDEPLIVGLSDDMNSIQDEVKFYLYTRMNQDTYQELIYNNESSVTISYINFNNPTTVVVHGFMDSISSPVNQYIKNQLLLREEHNVIGVDWSSLADTIIYTNAVDSVSEVGQYLSEFIQFLISTGQSLNSLHLIGHSLGAHVAGLAGRNFSLTTEQKIPRITGLDPAKPGFADDDASSRLDASDADFVDCIHTCSGELGLGKPVCTADFYPNGVSGYQPGCPWWDIAGICSHSRSYEYYAESIELSHRFPAKNCQSVPQTDNTGNCEATKALMGDPASPLYTGYYLVITNDQSPYSPDITNKSLST